MSVSRARIFVVLGLVGALAGCKEKTAPPVAEVVTASSPTSFSSTAGQPVSGTLPSVTVTSSDGVPIPGVDVVWAVTGGGGNIGLATVKTNSSGVAQVSSWTLGTVVGANTLTATVSGITPVTFTATGVAGPAAILAVTTAPTSSVANRSVLPVQPTVQVQDFNSNAVSAANVSITLAASVGSVVGTTTVTTNASGAATFSNIALAGTAGARTLTFSASGLTSATAQVTTTPGPATAISIGAGDGQTYFPSTAVPVAPAAKIVDQDGNGVAGVVVTFTVTSGGGSVAGGTPTSNSSGLATVTSWTLGAAEGPNSLSASATGLSGSPVVFTATSTNNPLQVTAVSPATLTSGVTATLTGTGFSATVANNTVTIDGVPAMVTAASGTSLTVTVPTLPCTPGHNGPVSVTVGGTTGSRNHPVQAATTHTLAVGASVVLSTSSAARCNELHNANTNAIYYVSVYNSNSTFSPTGASFELKGTAGAAAAIAADVSQTRSVTRAGPLVRRPLTPEQETRRQHQQFLERDIEFLRENGHRWAKQQRPASLVAGGTIAHAVGDAVALRLRDISKTTCNDFVDVAGRVAFIGTKAMIIEDTQNAMSGTIDSTYALIGNEFDQVMWPILENNFGNALINDANLDNNGKFIMVFSNKLRTMQPGIAGFVHACDLFPRTGAGFANASSNFGEYFYAIAPVGPGDINVVNSPPRWRWSMRHVIIHEVKHIVSQAERLAKNPNNPSFEVSWLEETTATLSEELYERTRYGLLQKTNIGYGSAANPVGPYCGVRLACNQARGFVGVFEDIGSEWYESPHNRSPIGRADANDFSFYATGWSLVRWAMDRSATAESTILKNMTQHATLTGIANFDAHIGTTYLDALPKWTLAMAVDDYPGVTMADQALTFPSWNLRNVFSGYKTDFPSATFAAWPLLPLSATFGAFSTTASVRAGTAAIIQLFGAQSAKQVLELKADGSSASAPAELRISIVRVQ